MKRRLRSGRQKRKLLVDTNILLLYVIGSLGLDRIARHKRTGKFTAEDYGLFRKELRRFDGIVVTPNILTEVSNLLGHTDGKDREKLLALLGTLILVFEERYVRSIEAIETAEFLRPGLADASILSLPMEELVVLTDDLHLYLALQSRGAEVLNFNHLRERSWQDR